MYAQIKADPQLTIAKIATMLSLSDRMVKKHLSVLKENGLIMRVGSNKTGHWEINKG